MQIPKRRIYTDGSSVKGTGFNVVPLEDAAGIKASHHGRQQASEGKVLRAPRMSDTARRRKIEELTRRLAKVEQERSIILTRLVELGAILDLAGNVVGWREE